MTENDAIRKFQGIVDDSEYMRMLNIRILELDDDHAKGSMPYDRKYCNPYGSLHGGAIYSLADTVAGVLADNAGCDVMTVEGSMHFLEPAADTEFVYCEAVMKKCGKHLVTVDVMIKNDKDSLLDCGTYTFYRLG